MDLTYNVEGRVNRLSIPPMSAGNRARHDPASNPCGERCNANAAIGRRLLAWPLQLA
jgi:hypothetical protein